MLVLSIVLEGTTLSTQIDWRDVMKKLGAAYGERHGEV